MKRDGALGPDLRRLFTYKELPIGATSIGLERDRIKTGTWRFFKPIMVEKTSPCEESCPVGTPIHTFLMLIREGEWREAWKAILEENPFPSICGRICHHPCESACHRGSFDEALAIHSLERAVGDYGLSLKTNLRPNRTSVKKEKIAIVGAGPSGLACAYFLSRLGYRPTVFEALPTTGGMMRAAIPEYRLPGRILNKEICRIERLGVNFEKNVRLGKDLTFQKLFRYDAVFLSLGVFSDRPLDLPGVHLRGVLSGLHFLLRVKEKKDLYLGKRVVVIGGGNTAIDCARTALRLGTDAKIFYRRTHEEMPAFKDEILEADEEGIEFTFLAAPLKILGENNHVAGVEFCRNRLGKKGPDGRRVAAALKGNNFRVRADTVILALGEEPDIDHLPDSMSIEDGKVVIDKRGATSIKGIFAGGDLTSQPRTAAHAIASGKRGAISIDLYLKGITLQRSLRPFQIGEKGGLSIKRYLQGGEEAAPVIPFEDLNFSYFERENRVKVRKLPYEERRRGFKEINLSLPKDLAFLEANRCINCGSCNGCDHCLIYCPDSSVFKGEKNEIDYNYCKGCGICENECPAGFIQMEKEEVE